tara:strand:+ start:9572 stop:9886 length:315 start_codon:yes stop_codon:yes gene_type:complete
MVEIVLLLSILLNIFLMWYARNTLSNLLYLSDNLGLLYEVISAYNLHLKEVYELERFYGDPTLSYLLEHTNAVREELEGYEEIFLLSEPTETEQEVELDGKEEA